MAARTHRAHLCGYATCVGKGLRREAGGFRPRLSKNLGERSMDRRRRSPRVDEKYSYQPGRLNII